jgi:uncharacterized protein YdeI (YjbR/CyaY-like superfamily)
MGKKDPRVDAYIEKSAEFARPILKKIRKAVHAGCPEVEETLKWSFPHFTHRGILCSMAAFKEHCAFGFWKESLFAERARPKTEERAMGQFGRLRKVSDLPSEATLVRMVREAVALNEQEVKSPTRSKAKVNRKLEIPDYFMSALRRNRRALETFDGFNFTNQREYVEWVTEAKREETRKRRLETTVAWLAEGKVHNWRYVKC